MPKASFVLTATVEGSVIYTESKLDTLIAALKGPLAAYAGAGATNWEISNAPDVITGASDLQGGVRNIGVKLTIDAEYVDGDPQAPIIESARPVYDAAALRTEYTITDHYWSNLPVSETSRVDEPFTA